MTYKYCLEDTVVNIRERGEEQEFVADTLDGREVYVRPQEYVFDKKIDDNTYYRRGNRL